MEGVKNYLKTEKVYGFSIPVIFVFCIITFVAMYTGGLGVTITVIVSSSLFAGVFGYFLGFYAVDSAITAALCQADMGGGADIAILTPSDRMGLIAYATVASRIGYAIVLILASIIFPMVL